MQLLTSTLILALLVQGPPTTHALSQPEYDTLMAQLVDWFYLDPVGIENLPGAVRLGFHDCVGGCDGCLNLVNPQNAGLDITVTALEQIYQTNVLGAGIVLSRADFWSLASIAGVNAGIKNANYRCPEGFPFCLVPDIDFTFRWGRLDCTTSPDDFTSMADDFPSPFFGRQQMIEYFMDPNGFALTETEIIAVMGAHTLGEANKEDSGYDGVWIPGEENVFDNKYYKNMLQSSGIRWSAVDVAVEGENAKWQYEGTDATGINDEGMMFNTDFEVFYDIEVDSEGEPTCHNPHECPQASSSYALAERYANDIDLWIVDFKIAFTKMLETGNPNLAPLAP